MQAHLRVVVAVSLSVSCGRGVPPGSHDQKHTKPVAFYVTAHQDDWQLFRGEVGWDDLIAAKDGNARLVFIALTAGNGVPRECNGCQVDPEIQEDKWWQARELGALASIQAVLGGEASARRVTFKGANNADHNIVAYDLGHTTSYFLRLEDGTLPYLSGSPAWGGKPRGSDTPRSVDPSVAFADWDDVVATLRSILDTERVAAGAARSWINTSDFSFDDGRNPAKCPYGAPVVSCDCRDRDGNPLTGTALADCQCDCGRDNPDHIATGLAVRDASGDRYNHVWWRGYSSGTPMGRANLTDEAIARKLRLMCAYTEGLRINVLASNPTFDDWCCSRDIYESWIARSHCWADSDVVPGGERCGDENLRVFEFDSAMEQAAGCTSRDRCAERATCVR